MRKRPKGRKYRNLTARGGVIYYQRVVDQRRVRVSTKTDDWDEAAAVRDLYEERKGIGSNVPFLEAPRSDIHLRIPCHSALGHPRTRTAVGPTGLRRGTTGCAAPPGS